MGAERLKTLERFRPGFKPPAPALTTSERAMVAAGLVPMFEAEAAERQAATRIKAGKAPTVSADLRSPGHGKAAEKAATAVNVSPRSVEAALKVVREAGPRDSRRRPQPTSCDHGAIAATANSALRSSRVFVLTKHNE